MLYEPIGEQLGVHYLPQGYFGMQTEAASVITAKLQLVELLILLIYSHLSNSLYISF